MRGQHLHGRVGKCLLQHYIGAYQGNGAPTGLAQGTPNARSQVAITLRAADKALLGETAAKLRGLRKPDPYKGKGIKYAGEAIRRKVGKKAGAK